MKTLEETARCRAAHLEVLGVSRVPGAFAASAYDCPGQKLAALTFDDGPGRYSAAILDTLKAHGVKATFFMNGNNIWIYASKVQRMVAEGHQVANHTYNHPDLVQSSDALVRQEIGSAGPGPHPDHWAEGDREDRLLPAPALWQPEPAGAVPGGGPGGLLVGGLQRLEVPRRQSFGQLRLLPDQGRGHHLGP